MVRPFSDRLDRKPISRIQKGPQDPPDDPYGGLERNAPGRGGMQATHSSPSSSPRDGGVRLCSPSGWCRGLRARGIVAQGSARRSSANALGSSWQSCRGRVSGESESRKCLRRQSHSYPVGTFGGQRITDWWCSPEERDPERQPRGVGGRLSSESVRGSLRSLLIDATTVACPYIGIAVHL